MKCGFFYRETEADGFYGLVYNDRVRSINNLIEKREIEEYELKDLKIGVPVRPSKIVAVGLNYRFHAEELKNKLPEEPIIFLKPPSSVIPHLGTIVYPDSVKRLDYEAELGVVIKKTAKKVRKEEAKEYILGYTAFNDVTARDLQAKDGQWTRAKGFDTFSPFGPFIETEIENPENLRIQAILNDEIKQDASTSAMIFGVSELISFISHVMTLYPGDLIATGTPEGIGPMVKGDRITVRIEGLNDLTNYVG